MSFVKFVIPFSNFNQAEPFAKTPAGKVIVGAEIRSLRPECAL